MTKTVVALLGVAENAIVFGLGTWVQGRRNRNAEDRRREEVVRALVTALWALLPNLIEFEQAFSGMGSLADGSWQYFSSTSWALDERKVDRLARAAENAATLGGFSSAIVAADAVRKVLTQYTSIKALAGLAEGKETARLHAPAYHRHLIAARDQCRAALKDARPHAPVDSQREIDRLLP